MSSNAVIARGSLYAQRLRLRRWVRAPEDAADVAQTVEEKLLRSGQDPNAAYLTTTLRNAAIDAQRAASTRALHESQFAEQAAWVDDRTPERCASGQQAYAALKAALETLSPLNREIFLRACVHDEPRALIAAALGLKLSTIEKRLAKARAHCVERIAPYID